MWISAAYDEIICLGSKKHNKIWRIYGIIILSYVQESLNMRLVWGEKWTE